MNRLKGELYTIENAVISSEEYVFDLRLNPDSRIYGGHFPGNPITPGVCLLQIAVELCEDLTGHKCQLIGCRNIKYIQIISPKDYLQIRYVINTSVTADGNLNVKLSVRSGDAIFTKMSIVLKEI